MKTQVIQLEAHDDVISVRDKMSWAKTERIVLVFPLHSRILTRIYDLKMLQRHAKLVGAELALVTRNGDLRSLAKELDIPFFFKVSTAKRKNWHSSQHPQIEFHRNKQPDLHRMRREPSTHGAGWQDRFVNRLVFFTLGILAILAVLFTFFPSATILLDPTTQQQTLVLKISSSTSYNAINLAGSLPARTTSLIIERTKSVPVTGSIAIPNSRATGSAQFRNLTTLAVVIPSGTVITTQAQIPVRFSTLTDARVEAGVGKTSDIPIMAVEPGTSGNLPAEALIAIQGNLGASLGVSNPINTSGGSDRISAMPTAGDRSALHSNLLKSIYEECKNEIQNSLLPGDIIFPDTMVDSQILGESYFPAEGQIGDTLSITLRLKCQMQYAHHDDLNKMAQMVLDLNLPKGYIPITGSLRVDPVSKAISASDKITRLNLQVQRLLQAKVEPLNVEQMVVGHRPRSAKNILGKSLSLTNPPVIQIKPAWWPWLPLIPYRIAVDTVP
jgi:hypothetical protein